MATKEQKRFLIYFFKLTICKLSFIYCIKKINSCSREFIDGGDLNNIFPKKYSTMWGGDGAKKVYYHTCLVTLPPPSPYSPATLTFHFFTEKKLK